MDETLLQFGRGRAAITQPPREERRARTICPLCAQRFSPDGRFCPFDGQALLQSTDAERKSDALLGTLIDQRYEVLSLLGEGGMGIVYEARHRALGKRFALKALRKELAADTEICARFMQEARTAASVSHPGLVEITDFGRLPTGQPFFVMALIEGQSLASLIRRGGPLPAGRAVEITRQLAEALGAAHERSIVHRDLKPDNIHLSEGEQGAERVTIVDFGLAKVMGASRLTRAGVVFGTPHYMSPEQAMGEATDHRADIYALGIVMYEMFTGRVPFEADSYMGVLTKHLYMTPTRPSQLMGTEKLGVLEDILLRCLEKKPENRYSSVRDLIRDLDLALRVGGEQPSAVRQRRVSPRSLLADELELPEREPTWFTDRPSARFWASWPLLALSALFVAGVAGALLLRKATLGSRPLPASIARSVPPSAVAPPPGALTAPPLATPLSAETARAQAGISPLVPASSAASPTPVQTPSARVAAPPSLVPRVNLRGQRAAGRAAKTPTRPKSAEIVDPWAK